MRKAILIIIKTLKIIAWIPVIFHSFLVLAPIPGPYDEAKHHFKNILITKAIVWLVIAISITILHSIILRLYAKKKAAKEGSKGAT